MRLSYNEMGGCSRIAACGPLCDTLRVTTVQRALTLRLRESRYTSLIRTARAWAGDVAVRKPTCLRELTDPVRSHADDQGRHVAPNPSVAVVGRIGEPTLRSSTRRVAYALLARPHTGSSFHRRPSQRRNTTRPSPLLDQTAAHHAFDRDVTASDDIRCL